MDTTTNTELEYIARLANKAREEGVQLYRDNRDGRHYASSGSTPGKRYFVTLFSCTCTGFQTHQRCKHWAALQIAHMQPSGTDPAPASCATCGDTGTITHEQSRWIGGGKLGYRSVRVLEGPCACQTPEPIAA